jgi:AraC-like DNA-binding protein
MWTKATHRPATGLLRNRMERRALAPGVDAFLYTYSDRSELRAPPLVATGFEINVSLSGEWRSVGARTGSQVYAPGRACLMSPSEQYRYSVRSGGDEAGVLVGLEVYPLEFGCIEGADTLAFGGTASGDARLESFCRDVAEVLRGRLNMTEDDVTSEVRRFIDANAEPLPPDPLLRARTEIERTFDRPLYLQSLAEVSGLHPTTFSRAFKRRFGLPPIRYRLELRMNAAVRLAWSRPELSMEQVAQLTGFEDLSYFRRVFVHNFTVPDYATVDR